MGREGAEAVVSDSYEGMMEYVRGYLEEQGHAVPEVLVERLVPTGWGAFARSVVTDERAPDFVHQAAWKCLRHHDCADLVTVGHYALERLVEKETELARREAQGRA